MPFSVFLVFRGLGIEYILASAYHWVSCSLNQAKQHLLRGEYLTHVLTICWLSHSHYYPGISNSATGTIGALLQMRSR